MKRRALMLLTIALGALLQQLLPGWVLVGGLKPPILAAMALHYALRKGGPDLWIAVFFAAILQDGLDLGPFGPALLAFPALGLLAYRIRNEIFSDGLVTQLILGAFTGLSTTFVALVFFSAVGQRSIPPGLVFLRLFGSFCMGMVTLPLVSRAINLVEAAIPKRREGPRWQ